MNEPLSGEYRHYISLQLPELADTGQPGFFKLLLDQFDPGKEWQEYARRSTNMTEFIPMGTAWMYYAGLAIARQEARTDEFLHALRETDDTGLQVELLLEIADTKKDPGLLLEAVQLRRQMDPEIHDLDMADQAICDSAVQLNMSDLFETTLSTLSPELQIQVLAHVSRYGNAEYMQRVYEYFENSDSDLSQQADEIEQVCIIAIGNGDYAAAMRLISLHPDAGTSTGLIEGAVYEAKAVGKLPELRAAAAAYCIGWSGFYASFNLVDAGDKESAVMGADRFKELPIDELDLHTHTALVGTMLRKAGGEIKEQLQDSLTNHIRSIYYKHFNEGNYLQAAFAGIGEFNMFGTMNLLEELYFDCKDKALPEIHQYFYDLTEPQPYKLAVILTSMLASGLEKEAALLMFTQEQLEPAVKEVLKTNDIFLDVKKVDAQQHVRLVEFLEPFLDKESVS